MNPQLPQQLIVTRSVRGDETPQFGLQPRNPLQRTMQVGSHVSHGSRPCYKGDQFISLTWSLLVALFWAIKGTGRIALIAYSALVADNVYDLYHHPDQVGDYNALGGTARRFAKGSQEIVHEGAIAPDAVLGQLTVTAANAVAAGFPNPNDYTSFAAWRNAITTGLKILSTHATWQLLCQNGAAYDDFTAADVSGSESESDDIDTASAEDESSEEDETSDEAASSAEDESSEEAESSDELDS